MSENFFPLLYTDFSKWTCSDKLKYKLLYFDEGGTYLIMFSILFLYRKEEEGDRY